MQISVITNQITAPAAAANIVGGSGRAVVDGAENNDSVSFAPVEEVSISEAGRKASEQPPQQPVQETSSQAAGADSNAAESTDDAPQEPSDAQQAREQSQQRAENRQQEADLAQIRQLKARDAEVKAHEAAHAAVGGQLAGSPSYTYQRGPDGVRYAVGGEVPIDVSKVNGDPQATLEKMQLVQRAALAPAEPSSQDRRVAALAAQQAAEARAEISTVQRTQAAEAEESRTAEAEEKQQADAAEKERQTNDKDEPEEQISAADVFSEQNARMRRINEFLLEISAPPAANAGDLIDDIA